MSWLGIAAAWFAGAAFGSWIVGWTVGRRLARLDEIRAIEAKVDQPARPWFVLYCQPCGTLHAVECPYCRAAIRESKEAT